MPLIGAVLPFVAGEMIKFLFVHANGRPWKQTEEAASCEGKFDDADEDVLLTGIEIQLHFDTHHRDPPLHSSASNTPILPLTATAVHARLPER